MKSGKSTKTVKLDEKLIGNGRAAAPSKEDAQDSIYVEAFKKLPEQTVGTVRFFDTSSGDWERFTVYNADAEAAAKFIFNSLAAVRSCQYISGGKERNLYYVFLNRSQFEVFVRELLLVRQFRVEVFVNESNSKGRINWIVKYKGSPGNLVQFEDVLFSNQEITVNNGVVGIFISIVEKTKMIGIAHVNMNESEIHLIEFADGDNFANLETVLVQLCPKEAVFPVSASLSDEISTVKKILGRNKVLINECKMSDFDSKDVVQDMGKLLSIKKGVTDNVAAFPDFEKKLAICALAGVIKYLELLSGEANQNQFTLKPFDMGLYLKLDASACRALHLSLNFLEKKSRHDVTLLGTIDKCRTAQGHRLMAQFLRQPLVSKEKIEERFDLVEILLEDVILRQSLHDNHLRRVPDCQTIARRLLKKKAALQNCYKAYVFLTKMSKMLEDLKSHSGAKRHVLQSYFIDPLNSLWEELAKFKELIETTLDIDAAEKGEFIVRSDFDDDLKEIRSEMDTVENKIGDLLLKVSKELQLEVNKSIKLESNNQHGHYFRITPKDEKVIRNNKNFQILQSKKFSVEFRNSKLESLSNLYRSWRSKYETEQKEIVSQMSEVTESYHTCFEQLGRIIAELDVFTSFALVAANSPAPFVRPKLLPRGSGRISFKEIRHPCIESLPNVNYIPNDVNFDKEKQSFFIITGPNMGGKSTFLRSIGVATLLAHCGCFVPATHAEITIVDAILARVGANESLANGISTFMAEMIETSYILKTVTSDSLVLIDELGRGTSTYDGFGLCWSISKHLAKQVGCYCVFATHFHELTALSEEASTVANFHVNALTSTEGLTMLYKIEEGPCDRSFGLNVARYVGFPEDVMKNATKMLDKLESCQDNDYDDGPSGVKRRRDNKTAGQLAIDIFMSKLQQNCESLHSSVESGELTEDQAQELFQIKFHEINSEIEDKSLQNPYLEHMLRNVVDDEHSVEEKSTHQWKVFEESELLKIEN